MNAFFRFVLVSLALAVFSGCATSRGVIDVQEEVVANPETGVAVKFSRVTDVRRFEINPRQADIPSLKNNEIDDPAITSRAIARKRNGYGKALGDILLPEGRTVAGLVEGSLTKGLRENGYRVLTVGDEGFEDAVPIEVDIEKFWGWFSPGFWSIGINFETLLRLTGPAGPFVDGEEFDSKVERKFQTAGTGNWQTTIRASLDELNRDIAEDISNYKRSIQ